MDVRARREAMDSESTPAAAEAVAARSRPFFRVAAATAMPRRTVRPPEALSYTGRRRYCLIAPRARRPHPPWPRPDATAKDAERGRREPLPRSSSALRLAARSAHRRFAASPPSSTTSRRRFILYSQMGCVRLRALEDQSDQVQTDHGGADAVILACWYAISR